ncbi:hypothetical protein KEH51_22845 [[Brevibacterium] frigoritolerans]|uniref:Uncharacterized protein n=1 Tax=Peribacillus frigoritolerans TaxID=450367 RepID=A0A941FN16_9BACI|nr:hypothetical protein [Peribacillus frigoritolerans]
MNNKDMNDQANPVITVNKDQLNNETVTMTLAPYLSVIHPPSGCMSE